MKHADRSAYSDVEVQDLEVMLLEGKLREANRQLVQASYGVYLSVNADGTVDWSARPTMTAPHVGRSRMA